MNKKVRVRAGFFTFSYNCVFDFKRENTVCSKLTIFFCLFGFFTHTLHSIPELD